MKRQIFKKNEILKLAQNKFITTYDTERLIQSKLNRRDASRRYEQKLKSLGVKNLKEFQEKELDKLKKDLKTRNLQLKIAYLIAVLLTIKLYFDILNIN